MYCTVLIFNIMKNMGKDFLSCFAFSGVHFTPSLPFEENINLSLQRVLVKGLDTCMSQYLIN